MLEFPDINGQQWPSYTCQTAGRPKMSNEKTEIKVVNNTAYFKGSSTWDTIDVTLLDPISEPSSRRVYEWLLLHHNSKTGVDGYKSEYAKDITLKMLSPLGTTIQEWKLHRAWIENADFGDLDYSSSEPLNVSITLAYDYPDLPSTT